MEVLLQHGNMEQQKKYLIPLLDGSIRSAFLMTEPDVASSDATNIETKLTKKIVHTSTGNSVKYFLCMRAVGMAARCYELMLERSIIERCGWKRDSWRES